ncbi:MAG TPA: threonine--tRNA ligase, partial [Patescibacteria group bacterium]|nr:threonine--tRNA ligase [Patescibacteria group bacterium]
DAFKLTKVAGTTWRGKEDGTKLTRIYGIAFDTKEALETHVKMLEEAEKRDHKKLGPLFGLFTFSDLVGGGLPLFTPKGTVIREQIAGFVQDLQIPRGFQRVTIPHITKRDLYETSGHWDKYEDDLMKIVTREGHEFALKPMNCPHHTQIYASEARSYRDLPVRFSEVTTVYRDEQSGELSGLTRVRMITQDDAHIFCRFSQIEHEALLCWEIIDEFYKPFGMELQVRLSRRDPDDFSKYLGTPEVWEKAEALLLEIIKKKGVQYIDGPGEAAHYGPKIDFICHDSLGRSWQLATIQLDFNMPERFDLTCINEKGEKERIVMIHRAVTGSLERFMGVIIEHFAGAFPLWLAPVQVALLPISDNFLDYAEKVKQELLQTLPLLRVTIDTRSESIGKKIREATIHKIPHQLILGQKEMDAGMVAVRLRNGKDQGQLLIKEYVLQLQDEILNKKIES